MAAAEAQGRLYSQGNHKDGHSNSLWGRSRPARSMKGERGNAMLKDPNCALMKLRRTIRGAGERMEEESQGSQFGVG